MRVCKRCHGNKRLMPVGPVQGDKHDCWVCAGAGSLPAPSIVEYRQYVINRNGKLHPDRPRMFHKLAMSLLHKPAAWGRVPSTVDEVHICWRSSPEGRRAFFVWKVVRILMGIDRTTHNVLDIVNTRQYDPYHIELEEIAKQLIKELPQ